MLIKSQTGLGVVIDAKVVWISNLDPCQVVATVENAEDCWVVGTYLTKEVALAVLAEIFSDAKHGKVTDLSIPLPVEEVEKEKMVKVIRFPGVENE